ncbi:MAG: hypothetical protein Q9160_007603, partial [Pyrenula sp. 1 TL-2023]
MEPTKKILIFGDQTADCRTFLSAVFRRKGDVLLNSFLEQASYAIREEALSSRGVASNIPSFGTIQELTERYFRNGSSNAAIESALVCVAQLAHYIGYFEEQRPSYIPSFSQDEHVKLVGLCTGLIAAAAVASAEALSTLLPLAVESTRIAFRIGAHVERVSKQLDCEVGNESWSTIVVLDEALAAVELEKFHTSHNIPSSNRLWISSSTANAVTISGPPSVASLFFEVCSALRKCHKVKTSIHGPYHAKHLHTEEDIAEILRPESRALFSQAQVCFPVHSSVTGERLSAKTPLELVQACLAEILLTPIHWDQVTKACSYSTTGSLVKVHAIGPTNLANSMVTALKAAKAQVVLEDHNTWQIKDSTIPKSKANSDIAIVGMSGRFPNAADHELFWEMLEKGLDVHRPVPPDRYPVDSHTDPTSKKRNTSHTPFGNFIENPGLFDARFFNMSPREAAQTDPMQRLMLVTAYEAMEMAGIVPGRTPSTKRDRIGTFYGQTSDDWREINAAQDIDTYFISGGVRAFGPGRINYFFKFSGPSFAVDTACSSSMAALQIACTSLRAGECDTAFTGGANVLTNPDIFSGLSRGHFLSRTGQCKTFDNDADGYCRGDGVATVILKRMEDAVADRDPILAVIRGTGTNHSADAVSITHPCAKDQAFLFSKVLAEADTDAHDVNYVEMHGTGTQAGDGIEMESVTSVFAPRHRQRRPDQPLYLGAVKANIGHGEAASGVCALIKVLLMLQKSAIPPHCGIKSVMNKTFPTDLGQRNINIAFKTTPFVRPANGKRTVFLNNFSAAGGNTAVLLEDAPIRSLVANDSRSHHVVSVSAKSLAAFKKTIARLRWYVDVYPSSDLASLAYTTTARRAHYNYRIAFTVSDLRQLSASLGSVPDTAYVPVPIQPPQIAFAFTGQGSQYSAMGKLLYQTSSQFRSDLEEYCHIAMRLGFPSFIPLVNGSVELQDLPPTAVQLGMTCIQMALTRLWESWGVCPSIVVGHSLGEYAALNAAGVLSVSDTIFLVGSRAALLEEKCTQDTHAMLAVKSPAAALNEIVTSSQGKIEVACINGASETVLSGTLADIDAVCSQLSSGGLRCTKLKLPYAFHSNQVDPILSSFKDLAAGVTFHTPRIPVISPLISDVIDTKGTFNGEYLSSHCRKPVNFLGGLTAGMGRDYISDKSIWIEVGAHPICSGMIRSTLSAPALPTLRRDEDPWKIISSTICGLYTAGIPIDFTAYHQDVDTLAVLNLPSYGFDDKNYWLQYTNDWTLYKGVYDNMPNTTLSAPARAQTKLSTSVHKILSEKVDGQVATVTAETDFADPQLHKVATGHLVNGAGLCPSSLYADMVYTLTEYAHGLLKPDVRVHMNVHHMDNPAPFLIKNLDQPDHQLLSQEVKVDLKEKAATAIISSTNGKNKTIHGKCTVTFEDHAKWQEQWARTAYLVQDRMKMLKQKMELGEADKIGRQLAYRLFGAFVDYGDKYQGMRDVILDASELEACSHVKFRSGPQDGQFYLSPYFIDSTAHLSGFIMNSTAAASQVFISHGWESMRFAQKLEHDQEYNCYVKMLPATGKMVAGDVYIFNQAKEVVGVVGGLRFQCIPRTLLNTFLPPVKGHAAAAATKPAVAPISTSTPKKLAPLVIPAPAEVSSNSNAKAAPPKPRAAPAGGMQAKIFNIIAIEIAVDHSELADGIQWTDLGVDSLMSLTISGRFREELDLDVPSTLFTDYPTVGDLKKHFASQTLVSVDTSDSSSTDDSESDLMNDSGVTTPASETFDIKPMDKAFAANTATAEPSDLIAKIRQTIAEEMDIDIEELSESTDLNSLGMDSLMSLTILGSLRENCGIELEATVLTDNPSLGHLRKALGVDTPAMPPPQAHTSKIRAPSFVAHNPVPVMEVKKQPPATSVLLQGNPKTASKNLFLLPDGSGSATSYVSIPAVDSNNICVYGLNCPFMKDPTNYTCGIEGVSKLYLEEILRRQPSGPFYIGGWSAGGVCAYEVVRQLAELQKTAKPSENFDVARLILIDSPCPIRLEPLPARLHHFFDEIGLLGSGTGKTPGWLLPHFEYSIKALSAYKPELKSTHDFNAPPTRLIWATDGVCKNPEDPRPPPQEDDPKSMRWLLENRTDFGYNGWDKLLGAENCSMTTIDGNHFTMMKAPI